MFQRVIPSTVANLMSITFDIVSYWIIVWCCWRIWAHLRQHIAVLIDRQVRDINFQVNVVLIVQAVTPLVFAIIPSSIIALFDLTSLYGYANLQKTLNMVPNWMPVVNSVSALLIIRPYRKAMLTFLLHGTCRGENRVASSEDRLSGNVGGVIVAGVVVMPVEVVPRVEETDLPAGCGLAVGSGAVEIIISRPGTSALPLNSPQQ